MPKICFIEDQPELIYSNTIVSHTNSQNVTTDFALMREKIWAKKKKNHHILTIWRNKFNLGNAHHSLLCYITYTGWKNIVLSSPFLFNLISHWILLCTTFPTFFYILFHFLPKIQHIFALFYFYAFVCSLLTKS